MVILISGCQKLTHIKYRDEPLCLKRTTPRRIVASLASQKVFLEEIHISRFFLSSDNDGYDIGSLVGFTNLKRLTLEQQIWSPHAILPPSLVEITFDICKTPIEPMATNLGNMKRDQILHRLQQISLKACNGQANVIMGVPTDNQDPQILDTAVETLRERLAMDGI